MDELLKGIIVITLGCVAFGVFMFVSFFPNPIQRWMDNEKRDSRSDK